MKYAMVIVKSDQEWEALSEAERNFEAIVDWWTRLRSTGKIEVGAELHPPRSAKTIAWLGSEMVVTDGPYVEAKETVGGFGILNAATEAEAIEIVRTWPSTKGIRIEVRPIVGS